jgi:hypothetical protein
VLPIRNARYNGAARAPTAPMSAACRPRTDPNTSTTLQLRTGHVTAATRW